MLGRSWEEIVKSGAMSVPQAIKMTSLPSKLSKCDKNEMTFPLNGQKKLLVSILAREVVGQKRFTLGFPEVADVRKP